jgi:hypothetical protein
LPFRGGRDAENALFGAAASANRKRTTSTRQRA